MRCEKEHVKSIFDYWDLRRDSKLLEMGNPFSAANDIFYQNTYAKCILIPKLC